MNYNKIFQTIQSNLKIIAYDGNNNNPSRFYISRRSDDFAELTKALCVDLYPNVIFPPQYLGSYTARWCSVINISKLNVPENEIWAKIFDMEEKALLMLEYYSKNDWNIPKSMDDFNDLYITDYIPYIRNIPYLRQAFDIKRSHWEGLASQELLNHIFESSEKNASITISRNDLFMDQSPLEVFIIKVLMWGYPTKGRGNNIKDFLTKENHLKSFMHIFDQMIRQQYMNDNEIQPLLKTRGVKLSTLSKFLYFKKIKINGYPSMILDLKVISALSSMRFRDRFLQQFKGIKYENAIRFYPQYNKVLTEIAEQYSVKPDQIELFLFNHGLNLKP